MGKRIFAVVLVVSFLLLCGSAEARADGGMFGKGGRDITEPEQKAVIFFRDGVEELVLSVRYGGAAEEFAWLVPTPEPPEIDESDLDLFYLMSETAPSAGDGRRFAWLLEGQGNAAVEILGDLTVGAFDVTVVRSESAADLRSWLEERGFAYDREAEAVLSEYIDRGWCFSAMRVDPERADPSPEGTQYQLSEGIIDPLRFTFHTPEPVYPLRISSLNPGVTEVLVYVLAPLPYGSGSMYLEYAERWQPVQVGVLSSFSELAGEMAESGGCFVTKLRRNYAPRDMRDITFTPLEGERLAAWTGTVSTESGGKSPSWLAFLAMGLAAVFLMAAVAAVSGSRGSIRHKKAAAGLAAAALTITAVLMPLGTWVMPEERKVDRPAVDWPWEDDILLSRNGWVELVHADGSAEVTGYEGWLARMISPDGSLPVAYDEGRMSPGFDLDGEGRVMWSVRDDYMGDRQASYLAITDYSSAEVREVEIGAMEEVHDVLLSPRGDRLWVALNPGIPVNVTEVREYEYPSLALLRSIIHEECLRNGEMVLSEDGEPLLAGRFDAGEGDEDIYFGFLPALEEKAGFTGVPVAILRDEAQWDEDAWWVGIVNSYRCDAKDGSHFLLISGTDNETGRTHAYVLDSSDGSLYDVKEGNPLYWQ